MAKNKKRFAAIHKESRFSGETMILVDKETGVNYLWHASGYAGGMTVLLNADGRPVVTPKSQIPED